MIRIGGSVVITLMAGETICRCSGVLVVHVTRRTVGRNVGAGQRKRGIVVVER